MRGATELSLDRPEGEPAQGRLEDVYAVLSYYLRHSEEVDRYLQERAARAGQIRRENEERFPPDGVRERLLARKAASVESSC